MNQSDREDLEGAEVNGANREINHDLVNEPDAIDGVGEADTTNSTTPPEASRPAPRNRSVWNRLLATLRCEPGVFEEIAADPSATRQALAVVVVEVLAATAGQAAFIEWNSWRALPLLLLFAISGFAAWPIGAAICSVMSRWFSADPPRFPFWLRTVGFVQAPLALGVIPIAGSFVGWFYCLALQVVAVKRLARVSTGIAVSVGLAAFLGPSLFAALVSAFALSFIALVTGLLNLPLWLLTS